MRKLLLLTLLLMSSSTIAKEACDPLTALAENAFFEARGEGLEAMEAVTHVVINRLKSRKHPDTVCEVINEPYQFSWVKEFNPKTDLKADADWQLRWRDALVVASQVWYANKPSTVGNADHYHARKMREYPDWSYRFKRISSDKAHHFYDSTRPAGSSVAAN